MLNRLMHTMKGALALLVLAGIVTLTGCGTDTSPLAPSLNASAPNIVPSNGTSGSGGSDEFFSEDDLTDQDWDEEDFTSAHASQKTGVTPAKYVNTGDNPRYIDIQNAPSVSPKVDPASDQSNGEIE